MPIRFSNIHRNRRFLYKVLLIIISITLTLALFPLGNSFKYEFQKGKPWLYQNLYAPFNFPIHKTEEELTLEKEKIINDFSPYYQYNHNIIKNIKDSLPDRIDHYFPTLSVRKHSRVLKLGIAIIDSLYKYGVSVSEKEKIPNTVNIIQDDNTIVTINKEQFFKITELKEYLTDFLATKNREIYFERFYDLFFDLLTPNISINQSLSDKVLKEELQEIALIRGSINKGERIIMKGEIIGANQYKILYSLKKEYVSQTRDDKSLWLIISYIIIISLPLFLLIAFIRKYHYKIFLDNTKITFIYFNILLMIALVYFVSSYNTDLVYIVPLAILPIIINTFFGMQLAMVCHLTTCILITFMVPNASSFIYTQFVSVIVVVLTCSEIHRRSILFIAVGKIILTHLVVFLGFNILREGADFYYHFSIQNFSLFIINGLAILFVQPLTYIYEKTFQFVSNVSLLELSDTNSRLLKKLSDKAPGTFQHSLQVANLAETAAHAIDADALLTRVGALYHDIGKIKRSIYFTENQNNNINPHDELSAKESASIIINHVTDGICLGKKYKLPECIIDFIQTHHGTSTVQYFYNKALQNGPKTLVTDFQYPGPRPYSKETSLVMMADAVEASSKSIKNPTQEKINDFVDLIINQQISERQFDNADITFRDIDIIKMTFKKRLMNIYNLRIAYPKENIKNN